MSSGTRLASIAIRPRSTNPYVCPSCEFQEKLKRTIAAKGSTRSPVRRYVSDSRHASTNVERTRPWTSCPRAWKNSTRIIPNRKAGYAILSSRTAVNAPAPVPHELRELYQTLHQLQENASSYVDLSRLQLALRSLESGDPTIRVAFLGLGTNGLRAARKLARALLSDALGSEEEWEKMLLADGDGRSILLRYGETVEDNGVQVGTPMLQTYNIPSLFLQKYKIEVMIAPLNGLGSSKMDPDSVKELKETVLVPPVTIPNSAGGRIAFVRYPVHSALIIAEGINGAVEYGRFPSSLTDGHLINAALSLPLRSSTGVKSSGMAVSGNAIDIDLANHALDIFRESNVNGAKFGEEWQTSRVGTIANWLSASTNSTAMGGELKPAVEALILSILSHSTDAISMAESTQTAAATSLTVADSKRSSLQESLSAWAEEAHRDLQVNLTTALTSPSWRRTAWFRLFWRIDEVSLSASDILRNGWLVEAEQNLAFISGRILEAGVATGRDLRSEPSSSSTPNDATTVASATPTQTTTLLQGPLEKEVSDFKSTQHPQSPIRKLETVAELMQLPPMLARVRAESGLDALFDPPWPRTITLARERMLHREVPALHRAAQNLLLRALTTISGSSGLAIWLWLASGGVAAYEAGAIAALGSVFALRKLQKTWGKLREGFEVTAREDGRRVLGDLQERLGRLVKDGGRREVDEGDRRAWRKAREGVEGCVFQLEKVKERRK